VHNRAIIIDPDIVPVRYMLAKVTLTPGYDLCPVDRYKGITIGATLLMPQPDGMTDLMDGITRRTTAAKLDKLIAANTTYMRPATGTGLKLYIIRIHRLICRSPQDKTNPCIGLPMRDSIGYTGLIGKSTINCIRNNTVRPPLGSQDHNTCGYLSAYFSATQLCTTLNLLDGTKDDIAFKHRITIDFNILHFF